MLSQPTLQLLPPRKPLHIAHNLTISFPLATAWACPAPFASKTKTPISLRTTYLQTSSAFGPSTTPKALTVQAIITISLPRIPLAQLMVTNPVSYPSLNSFQEAKGTQLGSTAATTSKSTSIVLHTANSRLVFGFSLTKPPQAPGDRCSEKAARSLNTLQHSSFGLVKTDCTFSSILTQISKKAWIPKDCSLWDDGRTSASFFLKNSSRSL